MPIHPVEQRYTHRGVFATPGAKINPTGSPPEGSANRIPQIRPKKAASNVKGLKLNAHPFIKRFFAGKDTERTPKKKQPAGRTEPEVGKCWGICIEAKLPQRKKHNEKKRRLQKSASGIKGHKKSSAAVGCGTLPFVGAEGFEPPTLCL